MFFIPFYGLKSKIFSSLIAHSTNNHYIRCKNSAKFLIAPITDILFFKKHAN